MKIEQNSLSDPNNYKPVLDTKLDIILNKYSLLTIEYINFLNKHMKIKNQVNSKFFIVRGLEMLTTIFNYMLYYTNNIDLTYINCQNSIYFYVEFITQINDTEQLFLQLSSRDAVIYVYKKTIFEIPSQNIEKTQEECKKHRLIDEYIQLYKTILLKSINQHIDTLNIELYEKTITGIEKIKTDDIKLLSKLVDYFYYNIDNIEKFYELINHAIDNIELGESLMKNLL
jgi:hypothetical protein